MAVYDQRIDRDTSSIIIRKGAVQRRVVYNAETKFTIKNKTGSMDDVIVGRQVTCLGSLNDRPSYWLPVSTSGRGNENPSAIELLWRFCQLKAEAPRWLIFSPEFLELIHATLCYNH